MPGCTGEAEELHHVVGVAESGGHEHVDNSPHHLGC
jgi:hypothetical protein